MEMLKTNMNMGYRVVKKKLINIDANTKKLIKMQRTPKLNMDEQKPNNPISENIDEKKG